MPKVYLDRDHEHLVTPQYSESRGPVLRGESIEFAMLYEREGGWSAPHAHQEEQILYVVSGSYEITAEGETYHIGPGEASYHKPNEVHSALAVVDTVALSFKNIVDPIYSATGSLSDVPTE